MKTYIYLLTTLLLLCAPAAADEKPTPPVSISKFTNRLAKTDGFFPVYWSETEGKLWLEISRFEKEFLYVSYLSRGFGSNDVGLDRGQIGDNAVVYFRRIGPKVLMMQRNYDYRADGAEPHGQRAVTESFAQSTLWGFRVSAEEDGRVLVDATSFCLRDAHDVVGTLRRSKQGDFKLEESRSAIDLTRTRNFPKNTEIEAIQTFVTDSAGAYVRQVTPTPSAVTVQVHHAFVELPESGFKSRRYDPRSGYFDLDYADLSAPLSESNRRRFIARHRLAKIDPALSTSRPFEPITYYVDRGAPEPIRSALVEGASWWSQAFEAAGYVDAFRVELLPEDADPLDLRYNLIQWVHRATRGWSYGSSIIDPRTGEILKAHVTLGSLRARQDYLIAEGLLSPYGERNSQDTRMQEFALARIRQLSAHEVGHTLGLAHNFAASASDRSSVMDYPYPHVRLTADGTIDVSHAYDVGVKAWDLATIIYGYQDFAAGANEDSALTALLDSVFVAGARYLSDADARPAGSADPYAHLWDNGENAVDELRRLMQLRARVLDGFSERAIPVGTPLVMIEEALVPIYMFHRYQIEAAAKTLGGLHYTIALRGSDAPAVEPVAPAEQRRALEALLEVVRPEALALPEALLAKLPPQTTGLPRAREVFDRRTGDTFDPLSAAESVADICLGLILHPARAARLVEHHARDQAYPGLGEVIDRVLAATWKTAHDAGYEGELQRVADRLAVTHLLRLAANRQAAGQVRAVAALKMDELREWIEDSLENIRDESQRAHLAYASDQIARFQEEPGEFEFYEPVRPPAGSPIGAGSGRLECGWE